MKRLFLCYLFLMVAIDIVAQHVDTPKKLVSGYVITNDNDTIHGTIDYISKKEKQCRLPVPARRQNDLPNVSALRHPGLPFHG